MKCGKCNFEPRDALLRRPCPNCGYHWVDTFDYVEWLSTTDKLMPLMKKPEVVIDIGCGLKGVIAQHHWETVVHIKRGFACDIHVVKALPPVWIPLKTDAENLVSRLGADSVDFVTSCGTLEHIGYRKALRVLRILERICRGRIFITCSTVMREVDYKVKRDGNQNHYYKSFWDAATFEALGYTVDRERMHTGQAFSEEVTVWADAKDLDVVAWPDRVSAAISVISKRCCSVAGCKCEPAWWDASRSPTDGSHDFYWCLKHAEEYHNGLEDHLGKPLMSWYEKGPEKLKMFNRPPWRPPLELL